MANARDFSAELFDDEPPARGPAAGARTSTARDFSAELFDDDGPSRPPATAKAAAPTRTQRPRTREASGLDLAQAGAAGVNNGFYTQVLGLPASIGASAIDLLKIVPGIAYRELTGKHPPSWLEPYDREKVVGTPEYLQLKIREHGMGHTISNMRPDSPEARALFAVGQGAGSSILPIRGLPQVGNAAAGGVAGGAAHAAIESGNPEWAPVAAMAPTVAMLGAGAATKRMIRGGEAGRRNMEQRMRTMENAGIDEPSAGLASGNRLVQGVENLLSRMPGSMGLFERAQQRNLDGMRARVDEIRGDISPDYGPVAAGQALQADLKGHFRDRINSTTRTLNDRVADQVGPDFYTYPENALSTARGMSALHPGAPNTSLALRNGRIAGIADDLGLDVQGTPIPSPPLMNAPTRYRRADGQVMDAPPGIPFGTLKGLRTSIGEEASSAAIMGTPEQGQFKRLYGAMSEDMRRAVNTADRQRAGVDVGPLLPSQQKGAAALNRANTFYSRGATRAEELSGLANRRTPEDAYGAVARSLNNGPTVYQQLRGVIKPATRQKLVATIIDDLGVANPGQQNADGSAWSPRTFLTNYSKLDKQSKVELFKRLPGGAQHAENLTEIAKTADMLGDASKVWANPSGTAHNLAARATFGAVTIGALFRPLEAAVVASGLGGAHVMSRLLLNPKFTHWLAKAPRNQSPAQMAAYTQRLLANASLAGDKQYQQDVQDYVRSVEEGSE